MLARRKGGQVLGRGEVLVCSARGKREDGGREVLSLSVKRVMAVGDGFSLRGGGGEVECELRRERGLRGDGGGGAQVW